VSLAGKGRTTMLSDEDLLDRLQRAAFEYFLHETNPESGLVADITRSGAPASIAVIGLALSTYPVAVERGWITRVTAETAAAHRRVREASGRNAFSRPSISQTKERPNSDRIHQRPDEWISALSQAQWVVLR
jgi:hypothetical protein